MGTPMDENLVDRLAVMRDLAEDREKFIVRQIAFAGVRAVEIFTRREHDPWSSDTQAWLPDSDWSRLNLWLPLAAEDPEEQPLFYDQAWDEAKPLLRENWGAVRALVQALLEREELDAADVRSILEEAGCTRDDAPVRRVYLEVMGEPGAGDRRSRREQQVPQPEERSQVPAEKSCPLRHLRRSLHRPQLVE
jgi:hypothetical protein